MKQYRFHVRDVLHVGAHHGEEAALYARLQVGNVWWIEADPASTDVLESVLRAYENQVAMNVAVSDSVGQATFHQANNGESSSLLEFGTHASEHPEVVYTGDITVETTTIDHLYDAGLIGACDFVNLDIQGMELHALKGARQFLDGVKCIYTEVNQNEVYRGCAQLPELDEYLSEQGFSRFELSMTRHGWGDAFYKRVDQ
jgi:FkbM family methyltransferase